MSILMSRNEKKAVAIAMLNRYEKKAFTNNYIIGFKENGFVYASFIDTEFLKELVQLDEASRGQGLALRYRKPSQKKKNKLKEFKTIPICSLKYFNELHDELPYNRGEIFEKVVAEYYDMSWEKDCETFTTAADLVINEIPYQLKYEDATFCNEKTLNNLGC